MVHAAFGRVGDEPFEGARSFADELSEAALDD
jgi:hypothetical protein